MRYIESVAGDRPVLMAGDFNAEPSEPVYNTIVNFAPYNLSSAYSDLLASLSDDGHSTDADDENRVENLMRNEPPFTTWKIREEGEFCHTIDYVFYSRDGFIVRRVACCLLFCLMFYFILFFDMRKECQKIIKMNSYQFLRRSITA